MHGGEQTSDWCLATRWRGHFCKDLKVKGRPELIDCAKKSCPKCRPYRVRRCAACKATLGRDGANEDEGCYKRTADAIDRGVAKYSLGHDWGKEHWDYHGYEAAEGGEATRRLETGGELLRGALEGARDARARVVWISGQPFSVERALHGARKPIHLIMSVPPAEGTAALRFVETYTALREEMYRRARAVGFLGGVAIVHPKRIPSKFNKRKACADGLHWHLYGFGWIDGKAIADQYRDTNGRWFVRNLGLRDSLFGSLAYALSHTVEFSVLEPTSPNLAFGERRDTARRRAPVAVTWFGAFSYAAFKMPELVEADEVCEHCGDVITPLLEFWFVVRDRPPDLRKRDEQFFERVEINTAEPVVWMNWEQRKDFYDRFPAREWD